MTPSPLHHPVSESMNSNHPDITPGKYQHYKGGLYEVLGVVLHSETNEQMVLYRALYDVKTIPGNETGIDLFVRPLGMFLEKVIVDGKVVDRFHFVDDRI